MGFLKRSIKGIGLVDDDEAGSSSNGSGVSLEEERYMSLFMKIGRDFIHREDFFRIMEKLLEVLDIDESELELDRSKGAAEQRAEEYKHFLKTGQSGNDYYPDLIDLNRED
jgi:hypothetical protein